MRSSRFEAGTGVLGAAGAASGIIAGFAFLAADSDGCGSASGSAQQSLNYCSVIMLRCYHTVVTRSHNAAVHCGDLTR